MIEVALLVAAFAWLICGGWAFVMLSADDEGRPSNSSGLIACMLFAPFAFGMALAVMRVRIPRPTEGKNT